MLRPALAVAITALQLAAQNWPELSSLSSDGRLVHDRARDRMVWFGSGVREWDGTRWLESHVPNQPAGVLLGTMRVAYDAARRHVVVLYGANTWGYDGASWRLLMSYNPGQLESTTRDLVYDEHRQVVVYYNPLPGVQSVFEWNGTTWRAVPAPLPAFMPICMGYDPVRRQVVAFSRPTASNDTAFAFDGTSWSTIPGAVLPANFPEIEPTAFTDPVRNRLIAYGGLFNNQVWGTAWAWDGAAWSLLAQGPPRWRAAVAAHPVSGDWLLSGGYPAYGNTAYANDTWVFDGTFRRVEVSPVIDRIVTDPGRRRIVGQGPEGTWEWDGVRWQQVATTGPVFANLVYDPVRAAVIGLENNFSLPIVRIWSWNGASWQLHLPAVSPPWQRNQVAAWDPVRQVLITLGLHGTWQWDGFTWVQRLPNISPPLAANTIGAAAFDPWVQRVVMLLQAGSGTQEWEWDGNDWLRTTTTGVPTWSDGQLATDPRTGRFVFVTTTATFSRRNGAWTQVNGGTGSSTRLAEDPFTGLLRHYGWSGLDADVSTLQLYGSGCGSQGTPVLAPQGRPRAYGGYLRLDLHGISPSTFAAVYGGFAQASTPIGGCTVLLASPAHFGSVVTNSTGFASLPVPIPNLPLLRGLDVFFQGLVLQTGGPLGGFAALTNGVRAHVGD